MKNITNFINEAQKVDINKFYQCVAEIDKLDPKAENDMKKLNVLAMDALDLYWGDANWDKKINSDLYKTYEEAFALLINKKNEEAKEKFVVVINTIAKKIQEIKF